MIIDAQNLLWDAAALTATAYSTNAIDLGAANKDISVGEPLCLVLQVDVAADGTTTDETYAFAVIQSANSNLSSEDTLISRTLTYAQLTAGSIFIIPLPAGSVTKRYIGAKATLGGTTPSVTVTAFIQPLSMIQMNKVYADAITIS